MTQLRTAIKQEMYLNMAYISRGRSADDHLTDQRLRTIDPVTVNTCHTPLNQSGYAEVLEWIQGCLERF